MVVSPALREDAAEGLAVVRAGPLARRVDVGLVSAHGIRLFKAKLRIWMPEFPPEMRYSRVSSKSSTSPWVHFRNELWVILFSSVVSPVMIPSSTRQSFGSPSHPSRFVPLKSGTASSFVTAFDCCCGAAGSWATGGRGPPRPAWRRDRRKGREAEFGRAWGRSDEWGDYCTGISRVTRSPPRRTTTAPCHPVFVSANCGRAVRSR